MAADAQAAIFVLNGVRFAMASDAAATPDVAGRARFCFVDDPAAPVVLLEEGLRHAPPDLGNNRADGNVWGISLGYPNCAWAPMS